MYQALKENVRLGMGTSRQDNVSQDSGPEEDPGRGSKPRPSPVPRLVRGGITRGALPEARFHALRRFTAYVQLLGECWR